MSHHGKIEVCYVAWCGAVRALNCGNALNVGNGRRC